MFVTKRLGALWVGAFALLVLMPLLVVSAGMGGPTGSGWWFDFAMGVGFGALAMLGGQFVVTARFRRATAPFGIDVVYVFHRWLGVIGLALVLLHYGVLRVRYPRTLVPALPPAAPTYMTAGRLALAAFVLLIVSSVWRKRLGIEYDRWRTAHGVLAVGGMTLAAVHVLAVGYYSGQFWNRLVLDLFFGSTIALVAYVRVVKPILSQTLPYRVTEVRAETPDTWTIRVVPEGHDGFRFMPGQFGWLSLGVRPWKAKEHPFSFSSSAEDRRGLEFTIKELGDFTRTVGRTERGTHAWVDGPHGSYSVDRYPNAPGFFFLAGGVGIAPIMSMLRTLADRGDPRPVRLAYGSRSLETLIFRDEIEALGARLDLRSTIVLREPPPGWQGSVGVPDPEVLRAVLEQAPQGVHAFLCGPVPMNEMAERALRHLGIPGRRIHLELFDMA